MRKVCGVCACLGEGLWGGDGGKRRGTQMSSNKVKSG